MDQQKLNISPEEKLKIRLAMSYEERYKSALKTIRLINKLREATIIKPKE